MMKDAAPRRGPKRLRIALVTTALVAFGGLATAWAVVPESREIPSQLLGRMAAPTEVAPDPVRPRGLRVVIARLAPQTEERTLTGTVVARYEAPVGFRVAGEVLVRHVEIGQIVRAGDPLLDLDQADVKAALGAAEAALAAAEAQARQTAAEEARQASLLANGWVSQAAYDRVRAASDTAREAVTAAADQVEIARNTLGYTRLKAPTDGLVTALMAETGQLVAAGQAVITLVQPGPREALISVPEGQLADLAGWSATASLWSDPVARHAATLREVAPEADPVGRTHAARFTLTGAAADADLGGTVTVHLARRDEAPASRLPSSALFFKDDAPFVWTLAASGDRVSATPVEVVHLGTEDVVLRGLADGARVVTLGVHRLDDAMTVRVLEEIDQQERGA